MAAARELTTTGAAEPRRERVGGVAARADEKGVNDLKGVNDAEGARKEEATPGPSGVASIRSFDLSAGGLPDQYFYWMASLKPLPARNPGVFDAAM